MSISEKNDDLQNWNLPEGQTRDIARDNSLMTHAISYSDVVEQIQSRASDVNPNERIIIIFHSTDPENPDNWSWKKKYFIVFAGSLNTLNSTLGSSLPSNAISFIASNFHVENEVQQVLPISVFLLGYVFGPLVCAPLSEQYGRKPVLVTAFIIFTLFTLACALASNWPSFLVFRFICGASACAPIALLGGLYSDIYHDPHKRGYALATFMVATTFGPCIAPIISGYSASTIGWRWTFWIALILAAITLPFVIVQPESYAPVLLQRRAHQLRTSTGNTNIVAKADLDEPQTLRFIVTKVLTRPIRMLVGESIVFFTCIYLALVYSIFYLNFEAYPIIFTERIYTLSPGASGLTFLPIALGAVLTLATFHAWAAYLARSTRLRRPWTARIELHRLPLAVMGGLLIPVALLWLGFSASAPATPLLVPVFAGALFGLGFLLVMMAMLNYLTDAYGGAFAASAQGISSTTRSCAGALLPLAARRLFAVPAAGGLGVNGACGLLAAMSAVLAVVPWGFIVWGERLRRGSKIATEIRELEEKEMEEEEKEIEERRKRRMATVMNDSQTACSNPSSSSSSDRAAAANNNYNGDGGDDSAV